MSKPDDIPQDVWDAAVPTYYPHAQESRERTARAILAERERCARVAGDHHDDDGTGPDCQGCGETIAAAIRAGGH